MSGPEKPAGSSSDVRMHSRRVTMPDGRYLIYYTFDDTQTSRNDEAAPPEADARPDIIEEDDV